MTMRELCVRVSLGAGLLLALVPGAAWAQTGSIAGAVRDTTGAVLPGVTVEASSPALIEKVRTVVTDGDGQYKILDLRPGVYSVTFTLAGFRSVRREGLELSAGATVNVPAEMAVGAVEETITVTGATPLVDVQNVAQHRVVDNAVIQSLPTNRSAMNFAVFIPGVTNSAPSNTDVGGTQGVRQVGLNFSIHGSRPQEQPLFLDGMKPTVVAREGGGNSNQWQPNPGLVQEVVVDTGGHQSDVQNSGARINIVPKDGGNTFRGEVVANFTTSAMQASNLTDALRARGIQATPGNDLLYAVNPTIGGPLKQDTLWFLASYQYQYTGIQPPGSYYAKDVRAPIFDPDLSRPGLSDDRSWSLDGRVTWQINQRNKMSFLIDRTITCWCHMTTSSLVLMEASGATQFHPAMGQVSYNSTITNKLLFEAGFTTMYVDNWNTRKPGDPTDLPAVTDVGTGTLTRNPTIKQHWNTMNVNTKAKVSYVTGSHAFVAGMQTLQGYHYRDYNVDGDINLQLRNGVPVNVVQYATPYKTRERVNMELGLYAQDQWTLGRTTLNGGMRFDYLDVSLERQLIAPTRFMPLRDFAPVDSVPTWKDLSWRAGVAHDVFGNGKTAIKASMNKYLQANLTSLAIQVNPVTTTVTSTTRPWNDTFYPVGDSRRGNFVPDCDLTIPTANAECGGFANPNFGQLRVLTTYDPEYLNGWNQRGYDWETQLGVNHELAPGVSVQAYYIRHWFRNFVASDNLLVAPSDYSPYCVTAPVDSRLPGGGGNQICGFYDLNPNKVGQIQRFVTRADKFGNIENVFDGVDLTTNIRLPRGVLLAGGMATGRELVDNCEVAGKVDQPQGATGAGVGAVGVPVNPGGVGSPSTLYCRVVPPWQTQVKLLGVYPWPKWGITTSATFQNSPGPQIRATYSATNAQVFPTLGRNLSTATVASVQLIPPAEIYGDRLTLLDFRVAKTLRVGRGRIQATADIYNLFNASTVLGQNLTYGANWLRPTVIMPGRFLKLGIQADF